MAKELMKGNEAIALAAIKGGADVFFGYPITPQSEVPEYLSTAMLEHGRKFVQGESEVASINMIYGAAGAGARAMTSSSSPGIALMQEGMTYLAGAQLPCLIINMMRGGPGLGSIQPSQGDYFQATRGGGNGDYRLIVYAPSSIQEAINITMNAFDVAEKWRNPVMVLCDGLIGQMMEAVEFPEYKKPNTGVDKKTYCTLGTKNHDDGPHTVNSLYLDANDLHNHNVLLHNKYKKIEQEEVKVEKSPNVEDAELVVVAYGTMARIAKTAIEKVNAAGHKVGMIRPITLWPYPYNAFDNLKAKNYLVCEMYMGQMIDDVKIATRGSTAPVHFFGKAGGVIPEVEEVEAQIYNIVKGGR